MTPIPFRTNFLFPAVAAAPPDVSVLSPIELSYSPINLSPALPGSQGSLASASASFITMHGFAAGDTPSDPTISIPAMFLVVSNQILAEINPVCVAVQMEDEPSPFYIQAWRGATTLETPALLDLTQPLQLLVEAVSNDTNQSDAWAAILGRSAAVPVPANLPVQTSILTLAGTTT